MSYKQLWNDNVILDVAIHPGMFNGNNFLLSHYSLMTPFELIPRMTSLMDDVINMDGTIRLSPNAVDSIYNNGPI